MRDRLKKTRTRALFAFSEWFISARGVYQTFSITATICIFEVAFPKADPHGFWLLYWLTVYSAITQPALAYVSGQSADRSEEVLKRIESLETTILGIEENILQVLEHVEDIKAYGSAK